MTLLVLMLLGAVPAVVRAIQRRRRLSGTDPVHLAEGAWAELRATALDLGLEWPDRGTARDQARRVVDQVPAEPDDVRSLEGLLAQVERGRYARLGPIRDRHPGARGSGAHRRDRRALAQEHGGQRGPGAWLATEAVAGLGATPLELSGSAQ